MEVNENHTDRSQSINSAINYAPDGSYPMVTVDNRRSQKYSNLVAFISSPYATSIDGELGWNFSCKAPGSEKQAIFLVMQLKMCFQINCIHHIIQHIVYLSSILSFFPLRQLLRFSKAILLSWALFFSQQWLITLLAAIRRWLISLTWKLLSQKIGNLTRITADSHQPLVMILVTGV